MVNYAIYQKTTNPEYPMITHKDAKSVATDQMADGQGLRWLVRFSSYSWALVSHGVLPVSHGDVRRHGFFMESSWNPGILSP